MLTATVIFVATLLLVPFIGGEFMPHLDEGALWVRATMPYTISFEEASKIRAGKCATFDVLPASHRGGLGTRHGRTMAPTPRVFSTAVLRWTKAVQR